MKRIMMAGLLAGSCLMTARAQEPAPTAAPSYQAAVDVRYVDLDLRGRRGQVQEYDGMLYHFNSDPLRQGLFGDLSVGGQGTYGLFDLSFRDLNSTEDSASLNVDYKSTVKASAKYETLHHRMNFLRVGEVQDGIWVPKVAIAMRSGAEAELIFRRSESEFNLGYFSPEDSARFLTAQYWGVDKVGSRYWSWTGLNIQAGSVAIDSKKRDFTFGLGTNLRESGALTLDIIRSDFRDYAPTLPSVVDGAPAGSSHNGGVIKRQDGQQGMTAGEFKFRHQVSKDLAVTGAFTGRQRENYESHNKFNAVVGALNAAYRAHKKLSLLTRLYLRGYQIDESLNYVPTITRGPTGLAYDPNTHQMDKTTVRSETVATFRPMEKLNLKAAYTLEYNNRRDAPTQRYNGNRFFADGYFVSGEWLNATAHNDTKHIVTLGAKAELPLGVEAEAEYKRLQANRPVFVSMPNKSDDANVTLTVPLPQDVSFTLMGGYLQEKNTLTNFSQYSQTRNTYRAGLDWGGNRGSFGGDFSFESIRRFSELYLGSGSAVPLATTSFHASAMNRQLNTVYGLHGRVNLPKGFVVLGNGSYTRSTVTTPIRFQFLTGMTNDYSPSNVTIARGRLGVEYTPESYKDLTARVAYRVDDWVDKFDGLNSGRASLAEMGASMRF